MSKLYHHHVILYAVFIMLLIMGVESSKKIAPMPKKSYLEHLSKPILKIILEYLEIPTGFYFIRQTTTLYTTLRRPLTEVAYGQYARILLHADHRSATPTTLVTDLLPRFTAFLRTPLVVDVPFPDLPVIFLPDPLVFLRSNRMDYTSEISEAQTITMFRRMGMINYECTKNNYVKRCWINQGQKYCLPISYSPALALLKLHHPFDDDPVFRQHVRLPLLLIFTDYQGRIRTEYVVTWKGVEWQYCMNENYPVMAVLMTWISQDWIIRILIDHDGIVQNIIVNASDERHLGTFQTFDDGHSYIILRGERSFYFENIQAFYYPTTIPLLKKDNNDLIIIPSKMCCCNIV